jgi:iron complex outermembrane receptor protein
VAADRHWLISGNLAWLDAKYDEFLTTTPPLPPVRVDIADTQEFTNAPEFSGALNLEYRTGLANGGDLSARVGYSYQSEVWRPPISTPAIKQDGYGLLNAGVIWRVSDAWRFSLQGNNLTDKEYRTTGYNIPAVGSLLGFYGAPREYTLSVRYDF